MKDNIRRIIFPTLVLAALPFVFFYELLSSLGGLLSFLFFFFFYPLIIIVMCLVALSPVISEREKLYLRRADSFVRGFLFLFFLVFVWLTGSAVAGLGGLVIAFLFASLVGFPFLLLVYATLVGYLLRLLLKPTHKSDVINAILIALFLCFILVLIFFWEPVGNFFGILLIKAADLFGP